VIKLWENFLVVVLFAHVAAMHLERHFQRKVKRTRQDFVMSRELKTGMAHLSERLGQPSLSQFSRH
jgi:hypothetical protein